MDMDTDQVIIGIINYNGKKSLPKTLQSIDKLNYANFEVIVADNLSTDGSREWVQQNYPQVRCLCLEYNGGPAGARNAILQEAQADYVLFLDNDITLETDTLTRLMKIIKNVPNVGACHPEICDPNDPLVHRYNGGSIHYLCALISRNQDCGERPEYEIFDVVSGAALLIDRNIALKVGGFDEDYFFNWEDGDFAARLTLSGYLCVNVPDAIVHHQGKPRGTSKAFYMIRNRWFFILKLYSWRTLLFTAPMFLLFELSQALFTILKGAGKDYWLANLAVFEQLPKILQKRRDFQSLKVKRDRDWLQAGQLYIPTNLLKSNSLVILSNIYSRVLGVYWLMIRHLC